MNEIIRFNQLVGSYKFNEKNNIGNISRQRGSTLIKTKSLKLNKPMENGTLYISFKIPLNINKKLITTQIMTYHYPNMLSTTS